MRGMDETAICARPLSCRDASALIGIIGMLEGELRLDQLDPDLERHLRERLRRDGLLGQGQGGGLAEALAGLAQRLHDAIG